MIRKIPALLSLTLATQLNAQMITGVWKGKIDRQRVEVKIVQSGDSLTGTSYYFESANNYRRYSIKGYFDANTNEAVWWDDQLLDERSGRFSITSPGKIPMLSRADFNCPGNNRMMLDGKAVPKNESKSAGDVHLDKSGRSVFEDDWDFVIDNFTVGANDPYIIDSIARLQLITKSPVIKSTEPKPPVVAKTTTPPKEKPVITAPPVAKNKPLPPKEPAPVPPVINKLPEPSIEQKYISRKKVLTREIPLAGDSIELKFYDNGEIDGDSISLFLNDKLIFEHVRLSASAHVIKLAVSELKDINELTMVAENLGTIPPNTSYMQALVADKRYDVYLASSEGSSAMIRFIK